MKIEVKEGVFWDNESVSQSQEAMEWLQEEVRPNLIEFEVDEFKRPSKRKFENEKLEVIEQQNYIEESTSWARRGVSYSVNLKNIE